MAKSVYIITDVVQIIGPKDNDIRTTVNIGPVYENKAKADAFIDEIREAHNTVIKEEKYDITEESYKKTSYYKYTIRFPNVSQMVKHNFIIKKRSVQ